MKSFFLLLAIALIIGVTITTQAENTAWIYPMPPPTNSCLYCDQHPSTIIIKKHRVHRHARRQTGLFVYYVLPAPACCCGDAWVISACGCCANSGVWATSYYSAFKVPEEDLIYSDSNDDEYRPYNIYTDTAVYDDSIDDPD